MANNNRTSLKDYCSSKGYNMASAVRANVSGYKYITLIDSSNPGEPENVYLGQRFGETVNVGDKLKASELWVVETTNAQGEMRLKLSDKEGDATETLIGMGYDLI